MSHSRSLARVTYKGHQLDLFVRHHHPGDTFSQGVTALGAPWFALTPSGSQVSGQASSSAGGTSGGDGY